MRSASSGDDVTKRMIAHRAQDFAQLHVRRRCSPRMVMVMMAMIQHVGRRPAIGRHVGHAVWRHMRRMVR